ncbi:MAG: tRNA pseudouridine(55) synthase TruB, partial [Paracoccaceae bacterium]|nr:tRNA pseudouridine(55) synthase TruB [Paracoccaceae bacterium]
VRLGQATNTDDEEGEIVAENAARPSDDEIKAALGRFVGDVMQVPPKFSAVKIDGQRAYKLARDGEDVEIAARPLFVESLVMLDRPDADHVKLEMVCGKGGYVRSIARDLGEALGCFGHVQWLRRVWSGPFEVSDGVGQAVIEATAKTSEFDGLLLPLEVGLDGLPQVTTTIEGAAKMRNGNAGIAFPKDDVEYGDECWASLDGKAVAIGRFKAGELHPSKVFVTHEV